MRFGSVCSGIEAASVAWQPLGWKAAWFSEISPFPSRLLAYRYPEVPNHGSLIGLADRLAGAHREIDLLVGGTPCQSFSVAGLRGGLTDARGNLALEYCRLAAALRPRWCLWENVPGVLSSGNGRDFGSILGALVELGYGVAWRVLDARYFGVPQRRRRVFLVASLGGAAAAGAVLFEPEGVRGNPPASTKARKEVARSAGDRADRGALRGVAEGIPEVAGMLGGGSGSRGWAPDTDRMTFLSDALKCLTTSAQRNDTETETETFVATCVNARQDPLTYGDVTGPLDTDGSTYGICVTGNVTHALRSVGSDASEDGTGHRTPITAADWRVRRLTPRECERLMGMEDDYTAIPKAKDNPRYAALGNSIAVPPLRWIGERIARVDALLTRGAA